MTTTDYTTRRSLTMGTLVEIQHNTGLFKITCPTAWADSDHTMPTHYNVTGPNGRLHPMVPVERMNLCQITPSLTPPSVLARMLRHPELTLRLGTRLLGREIAEALNLATLAYRLVPRYKSTHCWACKTSLDNLQDELCPKCGGLQCGCGGCRCNWPYPPQAASSRNDFTSPSYLAALHLPR